VVDCFVQNKVMSIYDKMFGKNELDVFKLLNLNLRCLEFFHVLNIIIVKSRNAKSSNSENNEIQENFLKKQEYDG
jgi:predicted nucleotidyltransferase component of viral defense system